MEIYISSLIDIFDNMLICSLILLLSLVSVNSFHFRHPFRWRGSQVRLHETTNDDGDDNDYYPSDSSQPPFVPIPIPSVDRNKIKEEVLGRMAMSNRGQTTDFTLVDEIKDLIGDLEKLNPTEDLGVSADKLNGQWNLLFATDDITR